MEPSAYRFDSFHTFKDRSTGQIFPPLGAQFELSRSESKRNEGIGQRRGRGSARSVLSSDRASAASDKETFPSRRPTLGRILSFLSAEGIHVDETSSFDIRLADLPDRFDPNDVKARFTWFGTLCVAGIGMFIEAYVIITTGQVKTVWFSQFPACWVPHSDQSCPNNIDCCGLFPNTPEENGVCTPTSQDCNADGTFPSSALCNAALLNSISYSEFAGIMLGMLSFGMIADKIGKVRAGILTAFLMILGISFMGFFSTDNASTMFLVFSITYGLFGWGVGGEYPLTAMNAASYHVQAAQDSLDDDAMQARHRKLISQAQTARRGETISLVFAMQGIGAVVGSAYLLFLLYFSGQTRSNCDADSGLNSSGSNPSALNTVWRSFYLFGGTFILLLFIYRTLIEEEGLGRRSLEERKEHRQLLLAGRKKISTWKILNFYGPRLIGTGGNWFILDVAFYGLKLFSGPIFDAINPGGDLIVQNSYLLIYNLCGLVGYYCAAFVMDRPRFGRKRLQMGSFAVLTVLFITSAAVFNTASPGVLIFLYLLSNFSSTFGANTTTYVMAAETYPTELRGTCHGLSAFCGKLGALVATAIFGTVSAQTIFWICGGVSAVGILVTYVFGCDLTCVSLAEHDAQLELFLEGRPECYKGRLNAPQHLSKYEIWTGRHGPYDPHWARSLIRQDLESVGPERPSSVEQPDDDKTLRGQSRSTSLVGSRNQSPAPSLRKSPAASRHESPARSQVA